ncbi:MAG: phosphorylase [Cyanosarcina radialis HA8281-LM2]|jgi:ATP adenylyltransferase|nr:phosphorylase [Cyanosarcina radialis HA8281-LM2]
MNQLRLFTPGTLRASVIDRTDRALQCGALQPIPTEYEFVEQNGIRFLVRILSNLVRKQEAKQQQETAKPKDFNPFLPYEPDLFVTDISETHLCLLNKFNVVDYHLLIVTREFEEQESLLTLEDFQAMRSCLAEYEGLAFYNSGKTAGASQRHKHLQLVPLPLAPEIPQIPIAPLLATAKFDRDIGTIADFPFVHAVARLDDSWPTSPLDAAASSLKTYRTLLQAVKLFDETETKAGAYNLLATREWMIIVPRSHESFQSISVNSLGFAGALLVKDRQQMQILKDCTPLKVLQNVGRSL